MIGRPNPFARRAARRFLCALTLSLPLLANGAAARPLDDVIASKVLRVVVYADNKPFSYSDGGAAKGIDADIGRALAREIGVEAEFIVRMPGEEVDDDLRANVWRGPLTGGGVGDVMLHVPTDKELRLRNPEVAIGNAYFEERIAVAVDAARTGPSPDFDVFKREKIAVKFGTVSDYFLMMYDGRSLQENVVHFTKPAAGVDLFLNKEAAALMGVRSEIESHLHERGAKAAFVAPPMPGIARTSWQVGTAVHENSRDLGYAVAAALDKMRASGELESICGKYGVTYQPPAGS